MLFEEQLVPLEARVLLTASSLHPGHDLLHQAAREESLGDESGPGHFLGSQVAASQDHLSYGSAQTSSELRQGHTAATLRDLAQPGVKCTKGGFIISVDNIKERQDGHPQPCGGTIHSGHQELGKVGEAKDQPLHSSRHLSRVSSPAVLVVLAKEVKVHSLTEDSPHPGDEEPPQPRDAGSVGEDLHHLVNDGGSEGALQSALVVSECDLSEGLVEPQVNVTVLAGLETVRLAPAPLAIRLVVIQQLLTQRAALESTKNKMQ